MILAPPVLDTWAALAVLTAATDAVMAYRRLTGKLGHTVRAEYKDTARRLGGVRVTVTLAIVLDLLVWPLGLIGCLHAYFRDWRTYQAELRARAIES